MPASFRAFNPPLLKAFFKQQTHSHTHVIMYSAAVPYTYPAHRRELCPAVMAENMALPLAFAQHTHTLKTVRMFPLVCVSDVFLRDVLQFLLCFYKLNESGCHSKRFACVVDVVSLVVPTPVYFSGVSQH